MDILSLLCIGLLFLWVLSLHTKINKLSSPEHKPHVQPHSTAAATTASASPVTTASPDAPVPPATPAPTAAAQPTHLDEFSEWLKEDWLLKLGVALLLIAFGWFVTYAFLNNWIGPVGRISLGLLAGALIMMGGFWRMGKYAQQGGIIMVLGSTVVLLTTFAAREIYDFLTPLSALLLMFATTACVALASVHRNTKGLAVASLALAGIAPLLTDTPSPDMVGLFSYLLVVTAGAIWITFLKNWRVLTVLALGVVSAYSLPVWEASTVQNEDLLLLLSFAFAAVFFMTNTIGFIKTKQAGSSSSTPDLIATAGNGLFLLFWISTSAPEEWQSLIIAAWMLAFAIGGFGVFKITHRHEPFYAYVGVGIAMLAAATALELEGPALAIAYIIESALIPLVGYLILRDLRIAKRLALLLFGPAILSIASIGSSAWRRGVFHDDFAVLFLLTVVFIGHGIFFWWREHKEQVTEKGESLSPAFAIIGSGYAYILLWLSTHAALSNDDLATLISLVVYTLVGVATYVYGEMRDARPVKLYGSILLGFVVGRLLLVDVWKMALTGRIVTFAVIGVLLMSTAFLGRSHRSQKL